MMRKQDKGFTIVELIISLAISLVVISAIYSVFVMAMNSYSAQEDMTDLQQRVRVVLDFISREVKSLDTINSVTCTANNSSISFNFIEDTGTATSGTDNSLTDTSKLWTTNEWQNDTLVILDGTGNGQTGTISSNTSTALTVSSDWTTNPDNTSFYYVHSIRGFSRDAANNELDYTRRVSTQVFADNITGFTVQGYDPAEVTTCSTAAIQRLKITVTGRTENPGPSTNQYRFYTAETSVRVPW